MDMAFEGSTVPLWTPHNDMASPEVIAILSKLHFTEFDAAARGVGASYDDVVAALQRTGVAALEGLNLARAISDKIIAARVTLGLVRTIYQLSFLASNEEI